MSDSPRYDQGNEAAQKAERALRLAAARQERKGGPKPVHPADNPNAKRWVENIAQGKPTTPEDFSTGRQTTPELSGTAVEQFVKSDQFKTWVARGYEGSSGMFALPQLKQHTVNVGTVSDIRSVLATAYQPGIIPQPSRFTRIEDLFNVLPTSAGAIHYLRETARSNNAAPVPENTDPDDVTTKPTSTITVTEQSTTIRTIATIIEFPRQLMDDVPLLVAYLDSRMRDAVEDEKDDQFLHGDGTGSNILGLFNDSGVSEFTWSTGGVTGDNRADAYLLACAELWNNNYMADGIAMSYSDWVEIIKLKGSDNHYLFPQAHMANVPASLWTLPVANSPAFTYGQGAVGAFKNTSCAYIADREMTTVRMTNSHASRFAQNILTMLVEWRGALVICQPGAFRQVSLDAAPSGSVS